MCLYVCVIHIDCIVHAVFSRPVSPSSRSRCRMRSHVCSFLFVDPRYRLLRCTQRSVCIGGWTSALGSGISKTTDRWWRSTSSGRSDWLTAVNQIRISITCRSWSFQCFIFEWHYGSCSNICLKCAFKVMEVLLWCDLFQLTQCLCSLRRSSSGALTHPSVVKCGPSCCTTTATTRRLRSGKPGDCRSVWSTRRSSRGG